MPNNDVRVKITATLGFVGADRTDIQYIPREEWDELSAEGREDLLWEMTEAHANNYLECWYEVED